jgi:hypothetical protein
MTRTRLASASALIAAACLITATPAATQEDTVIGVAGPGYAASEFHERLLGRGYRRAWVTPVQVPVLDLRRFAGGLTPVELGGGAQTSSLRLVGEDGFEYSFRSVNKSYDRSMPDWARGTPLQWLREDQTAAQHPGGAVIATSLLDAVGILNPGPRLVVMPDDPRLGEFRDRFAGMLGTIELHANEGQDGQPLFGSGTIAGGDRVLEHLDEDPEHRVDGAAFLAERLMSIYLNDWDRHIGQYRFARYDRDGVRWWVPVPEDRDYALVHHDGLLLEVGRSALAKRLVRFDDEYPEFEAMLWNSQGLVRRLLAGVDEATWDSVAAAIHARLTDEAIDRAVATQPDGWRASTGERLRSTLRARRDAFPAMADALYAYLAGYPEIHGTDADESAELIRHPGGDLTVRLSAPGSDGWGGRPFYERRFRHGETREVRVFLAGGDDRAVVRGSDGGVGIRLVGGPGDDVLLDSSGVDLALYDARGTNRIEARPGTRVDRRRYEPPEPTSALAPPGRDWGRERSWVNASFSWESEVGPLIGIGPSWTQYGFRHDPFAWSHAFELLVNPGAWRGAVRYHGEYHPGSSPGRVELAAGAENYDVIRFHGFGNDAPRVPRDSTLTRFRRYQAGVSWATPIASLAGLTVEAGGIVRHTELELDPGTPLEQTQPLGADGLGEAGLEAGLAFDARNDPVFPTSGYRLEGRVGGFTPMERGLDPYGTAAAEVSTWLPVPVGHPVSVLTRVGGAVVFGTAPVWAMPEIGGSDHLRGWSEGRLKGDAALHGTLEVQIPLFAAQILANGTVGVSPFIDVGRVWMDGESPGDWHTGAGSAVWFTTEPATFGVEWAKGEKHTVHVRFEVGL